MSTLIFHGDDVPNVRDVIEIDASSIGMTGNKVTMIILAKEKHPVGWKVHYKILTDEQKEQHMRSRSND